jgi:hypothetical protein
VSDNFIGGLLALCFIVVVASITYGCTRQIEVGNKCVSNGGTWLNSADVCIGKNQIYQEPKQ